MKVKDFFENEIIEKSENFIENPIISVILPTYRRGDSGLLERSIKSVLNQTFRQFELIIVDDGSVDSTKNIIENFIKIDSRIMYIRNEINSGVPSVRSNQGLIRSRGKYIAYQFDDDQWYDTMLEKLYGAIKVQKQPCMVYGKCRALNMENKIEMDVGMKFDTQLIQQNNFLANNTVLHSKELLYLYGSYDCNVAMRRLCDWDLWKRWSRYIPIIFIDEYVSFDEYGHKDSIGATTQFNINIIMYFQSIDRDKELSLSSIGEYEVDGYSKIKDVKIRNKLIEEFIIPWRKEHGIIN